jgi:ComF family protein
MSYNRFEVPWNRLFLGSSCSRILDVLIPPSCIGCDEAVGRQGLLCSACFHGISFIVEPYCRRCGVPFSAEAQAGPERLCPSCQQHAPVYGQARAALRYNAAARRVILPFKHADRVELAGVLAGHMARAGAALLSSAEVLVPVPVHRARLFRRRYNQAAVLASVLSRRAGVATLPDALLRVRGTSPLAGKSAEERAAELIGAIEARPVRAKQIAGRRVLLIDDVMTSGATANACAAGLMAAGAAAVDVLAAARVPDPRLS